MRQLSNQQDIEDLAPWCSMIVRTDDNYIDLPAAFLTAYLGWKESFSEACMITCSCQIICIYRRFEWNPTKGHASRLGKASQSFPYSDAFAKGLHTTFDGRFVFEQSLGEFHDSYEGPSSDLIWLIDVRWLQSDAAFACWDVACIVDASLVNLAVGQWTLCLCCPEVVFMMICGFAGASPLGWSLWSTPHRQFQNGDVGSNQFADLNPTAVIMLESLRQNIVESGEVFAPGGMCLGIWLYTGIINYYKHC